MGSNDKLGEKEYTCISQKKEVLFNWLMFINMAVFQKLDLIEPSCNKGLPSWFDENFNQRLGRKKREDLHLGYAYYMLLEKLKLKIIQF